MLEWSGKFFGTLLRRWKSHFKREPLRLYPLFTGRLAPPRRVLWLAPLLLGLTFVAVTDPGGHAFSQAVRKKIIAALKDPLGLLTQRSPGKRSSTRHLTKTKTGPHERVLSTVRERPMPAALPPEAANPLLETPPAVLDIPAGALAPAPPPLPAVETGPGAPVFNPPFFTPFFPTGFPGPGGPSTPAPPGLTPPGLAHPGSPPPEQPPASPQPPGQPPAFPPPPESPPLSPPGFTPPVTISLPEPATWTMMGLGFLAAVVSARRRARKRRAR